MNCYEAIDLMEDAIGGCLPTEAQPGFQEHLVECRPCRVYMEQLQLTVRALEHLPRSTATSRRRTELMAEFKRQFRGDPNAR